jgi:23S rRNA (uridine2552-2'-O)-methyltransferase
MREIRDHYFKRAKEEHYLARSVYKLMEIDKKWRLLKSGMHVLDVGCAPGSWSQYILKHLGKGRVIGIDLMKTVAVQDERFTYIQADVLSSDIEDLVYPFRFDLVLSDAAPGTTGSGFADAQASLRLVERVFGLAVEVLNTGGSVVAKIFQGEDVKEFADGLREDYARVSMFKPKSSRKESRELYIIAQKRRIVG